MDEYEENSNEDNSHKRACPWSREIPVLKRRQGPGTGVEQEPESQLTSQRKDQRPTQQTTQSPGQFSAGERTYATSPVSIPTGVPAFEPLPAFTNNLRPAPVLAPLSTRSVPIPPQIPPPIFVDPQETEKYRAIWEFVVIFRLVRGSEVCLPCQDMILDFISNDAGASCQGGNCRQSKPGYPLPPGFNRHYLDYLVNGDSEPGPDTERIPQQSSCHPPTPAMPPTPALSTQMANLTLDVNGPPKDPSQLKKFVFEEPHSSGTCPQPGSIPCHLNLNHQRPTANLPAPITAPATATPSPSPAPSTGSAPLNWTKPRKKTNVTITPTMYLHYRSFRSVVRVIEAQAKIWIISRPDHFRETLHTRWVSGLPEELALKLRFACQGRYTLLDLATGRKFPDVQTADGSCGDGTAYPYMSMIRRYLVAVADARLGGTTNWSCTCPGVGWYQKAATEVTFEAALAAITIGDPRTAHQSSDNNIKLDKEQLLNQQINRFLTSTPSPAGPYIDPRITTILSSSVPHQGQAKRTQLDWMSLAFSHPTPQLNLLVLSYTGRMALHSLLRTFYQDLQTLYNEVEPLRWIASPTATATSMDTSPLTMPFPGMYPYSSWHHPGGTSLPVPVSLPPSHTSMNTRPFTFEKCALYLEMQLSTHEWGGEADETISKDLVGSILGNQPWDWPSNWTGPGETFLQGPAEEIREALGFLVSGALHWVRVGVDV